MDILIVDDTPDNLRLLSAILTKKGYEVRKAINGHMALISAASEPPDLILLDIRMPQMDGYQICECLKQNAITQEIPVIFISALDDVLDKVKAFAVGGVDYITKPFREAEVLARVENHIRLRNLQKQLVQKNADLEILNQELQKSNQELEEFSYIVSHDLQQPLQSAIGFAKLIKLKYPNEVPPEVIYYLERIEETGRRMQNLIQDLLSYAQLTKPESSFQEVNCNWLLKQAIANLQDAISHYQANIIHDELPNLKGNSTQLIQVFQNLISNAIKFSKPEVKPEVIITVQPYKESPQAFWLFQIQDNGIGINCQNFEQIFKLFQRLPNAKTTSGTGIGLATCKKIIEVHGGKIWVESQLHQGTNFYFILPQLPS